MDKKSTGTDNLKKLPDKLGFNANRMAELYSEIKNYDRVPLKAEVARSSR
jgi:hypothetical protein